MKIIIEVHFITDIETKLFFYASQSDLLELLMDDIYYYWPTLDTFIWYDGR